MIGCVELPGPAEKRRESEERPSTRSVDLQTLNCIDHRPSVISPALGAPVAPQGLDVQF
jgi:hypothetical protein